MTFPKSTICWFAATLVIASGASKPAAAQSYTQRRIEISGNVGAQTGASKFTQSHSFTFNSETETLTVDHDVKTALDTYAGRSAMRVVWEREGRIYPAEGRFVDEICEVGP